MNVREIYYTNSHILLKCGVVVVKRKPDTPEVIKYSLTVLNTLTTGGY